MVKRLMIVLMVVALIASVMSIGFNGVAAYEETIIYGDIDGDGKVTTVDARLALRAASGIESITDGEAFNKADVNGDSSITIFDARQILRSAIIGVSLQPSGAFSGVECEGGISITEENAVALFNQALNRIKTEESGYAASGTKTKSDELTTCSSDNGQLSSSVLGLVEDIIAEEGPELETETIPKNSQNYTIMSIEGSPYVSRLTVDDIYGLRASYNAESGQITLSIAIPDAEIEGLTQSAYSRLLNTEIMLEETNQLLAKFLSDDAAMRREFKNCVATVVIDAANLDVLNYTINYESEMYIAEATIKRLIFDPITIKGLKFAKTHSIEYVFNWGTGE